MRKLNVTFLLICTLFLTVITSCSNDDPEDDDVEVVTAAEGTMIAEVDGNAFTSLSLATFATFQTIPGVGTYLNITGSDVNVTTITLNIYDYNGVGTYNLEIVDDFIYVNNALYAETNVDVNDPLKSTVVQWGVPTEDRTDITGSVTITEDTDTKIVGTFEFTAITDDLSSTVEITSGAFNLSK